MTTLDDNIALLHRLVKAEITSESDHGCDGGHGGQVEAGEQGQYSMCFLDFH